MSKSNFDKMIEDFDSFAREHGYVRSKEWCKLKNVSRAIPNAKIHGGKISEFDYFRVGHVYYISIEKDGYKKCDDDFKLMIMDFEEYVRDHGYIRTAEYADKYFHSPQTVRNWYQRGILTYPDVVKMGEVYYMREDIDINSMFRPRGPKMKRK